MYVTSLTYVSVEVLKGCVILRRVRLAAARAYTQLFKPLSETELRGGLCEPGDPRSDIQN